MYYPHLQTLADTVAFHAQRQPQHVAIHCEDSAITYAQLHRESNRTAHALCAESLSPAARVAYFGKESEHYYDILFACAKSSAVLVPINWRLTANEVDHILRDSGAELLFVEKEFLDVASKLRFELPKLKAVVQLDQDHRRGAGFVDWKANHIDTDLYPRTGPNDPIVQIYTSGTTGLPKGVVLAHRSFFKVRDALAKHGLDWIDWRPGEVSLIGIPGFHIGGLWWATQGFNAGATNVAMRMFISRDAVDLIRRHGVTTTCLVPAMLQMMLAEPAVSHADFSSLRKVVYGGAPISETLLRQCLKTIGCEFVQIYGLTETGNTAVCLPSSEHVVGSPRAKAAGRPYPGVDLKIINEQGEPLPAGSIGEICIRTPARMLQYWGMPVETAKTLGNGYVHTGDAGRLDEDGFVYICDRIKDTIIIAGENVYPAEIENALSKHPDVVDSAVVGIPHERWGEATHAFVVLAQGHRRSPRELMLFLKGEIADFKIPASYEFIDRLPRNSSGKILRRILRDRFWKHMERKVN